MEGDFIKVIVPDYFKKFRCIADRCTDTCCAGWDVNFDPEDAKYYSSIGGEIGEKLRRHLAVDEDGDNIFTLAENRRCPFLDSRNLCELYIALGEESLCPTCTLFPRFYDDFGSFREMGLGFGCPEAARIMLSQTEPLRLIENTEAEGDFEIDENLLGILLETRKHFFEILNNQLPFKEQVKMILSEAKAVQTEISGDCDTDIAADFSDCVELMKEMEYIDESRKKLYLALSGEFFCGEHAEDFRRLLEYYIYRYALKAVYDGDLLTKIKYGVFACAVIGRIYAKKKVLTLEDRAEIMCGFSKEIEYSDVNMELLDNAMYGVFSADSLAEMV